MAKYVFLTSEFVPKADANGVCVYNVANELVKSGHEVTVICDGKSGVHRFCDNIEIFEIDSTCFKKLKEKASRTKKKKDILGLKIFNIFRRFQKTFTFFQFPNISPMRAKNEYKLLERINSNKKIDFCIGTFRPYEGITAVTKFKRKYPAVKAIVIYWDIIRSQNPFGRCLYTFFDYLCFKDEKKVFEINDKILIPESGMNEYAKERFDFARNKISYFEFPVFTEESEVKSCSKKSNTGAIQLTLIGSVDGKNRSIRYFLFLAEQVYMSEDIKFHINIVGNFFEADIYEKYKDKEFITFHGAVEFERVPDLIENADFLINISNRITYDMIPSKIFQYFASCKPIINFVAHKYDKAIEYFNKYPQKLNIFEYAGDKENDLKAFSDYISKNNLVLPDYESIDKLYYEAKPSYFAEKYLF